MTEKMFKAVHPDGTDFHTRTVQWAPPEGHEGEWIVRHPTVNEVGPHAGEYLSVSVDKTDLPGASWPLRLFVVEPVGEHCTPEPDSMRNKRAGVAFSVLEEIDAHERFGPQGPEIAQVIHRAQRLSADEASRLHAARDAAWDAAWYAARGAAWYAARGSAGRSAWYAARDAAWYAARGSAGRSAWYAAGGAAWGLAVRDLIGQHGFTQEHYDELVGPWASVIGKVHPDD